MKEWRNRSYTVALVACVILGSFVVVPNTSNDKPTMLEDHAPIARLSLKDSIWPLGSNVEIEASSSEHNDGDSLLFSWEVDLYSILPGNGTPGAKRWETKGPSDDASFTLKLEEAGLYVVRMTVDNGQGETDTESVAIGTLVAHTMPGFPLNSGDWEYRVFLSWWACPSRWEASARFVVCLDDSGVEGTFGQVGDASKVAHESNLAASHYECIVSLPSSMKGSELACTIKAVNSAGEILLKSQVFDLKIETLWGICFESAEIEIPPVHEVDKRLSDPDLPIEEQVRKMAALGVEYAKFWMDWGAINKEIPSVDLTFEQATNPALIKEFADADGESNALWGQVDWEPFDKVVRTLNKYGISPVPWIANGAATPLLKGAYNVFNPEKPQCYVAPFEYGSKLGIGSAIQMGPKSFWGIGHVNYVNRVRLFVAAAAERYGSGFNRIILWNTENELNWTKLHCLGGWRPSKIPLAMDWMDDQFLKFLLKNMRQAVHQGNPDAVTTMNINVSLGWHAETDESAPSEPALPVPGFTATSLIEDWEPYMDIVGIGAYFNYTQGREGGAKNYGYQIGKVVAEAIGATTKPVMVMETGCAASVGQRDFQRVYLQDAALGAKDAGADGFFWFLLNDRARTSLDSDILVAVGVDEKHWGLLDQKGRIAKPAFWKYAEIIENCLSLYQESFSDAAATTWAVTKMRTSKKWVEDGYYNIMVDCARCFVPGLCNCEKRSDFLFAVNASQIAGLNDNGYGVLFRYVDVNNFYTFQISGDGYVKFSKRLNGEWVTITSWKQCSAIHQGQASNHITVVANGSVFTCYVNDVQVLEVSDDSFASGDVGVAVSAYDNPGIHIAFDNVVIRSLQETPIRDHLMQRWTRIFGGPDKDVGQFVRQTSDGGYVLTGYTESFGAGMFDIWLIKTDAEGNKLWDRTFGGPRFEESRFVEQTSDGGYMLVGYTDTHGPGNSDVWLIKTDAEGNKLWDRTFGGSNYDSGLSGAQTSDGGYVIVGYTQSQDVGGDGIWLIKTDAEGNKLWDRTFGGSSGLYVQQTSDGGYVVVGNTRSYGAGETDIWLIKTDAKGNKLWDRTFGGPARDLSGSVQQTPDGGYIIVGTTFSYGNGEYDIWLIKTDSRGNILWDRTFGGSYGDAGQYVQQTSDGGYVVVGDTRSYGTGYRSIWLIKTDSRGNKVWDRIFGGQGIDEGQAVRQTWDGGYVVLGYTTSYGPGSYSIWLIKTDAQGNVE